MIKPFKWEGWDEIDVLTFVFYDCEMKDDFGKAVKGEKYTSISVSYDKGEMCFYIGETENPDFTIKFKLQPING